MTKTLKLISAAAIVAATSTAAFAQDVPLNTTVAGGSGAEKVAGQAESTVLIPAAATVGVLTGIVLLGGSSDSTTTTP
ncbi:MAG: hypothetical protein AAFQ19_09845 [Pseudomonadota bacterium]